MAKGQRKQKGGRTANLLVRLEPDVKAWLMSQGSAADWITEQVKQAQTAQARVAPVMAVGTDAP